MLSAPALLSLLGCGTSTAPPSIDLPTPIEPLPEGELDAAFFYAFRITGTPWESTPAGVFERTTESLAVTVSEVWREDSPFFPDCPVVVRLHGQVSDDDPLLYELVVNELIEDPCSIEAYAPGERYVVRFVTRDKAFRWLAPAMDVSTAYLEAGEADLENTIGPVSGWFAFWGPSVDVLWPIGHVFD